MAKKNKKVQPPQKTKLQKLMEQEYVLNSCQDCKIRIITPKDKAPTRCASCKSTKLTKEAWS